ncbi:hypothetical protein FR838_20335 (plasmid) [Acinetobacter pittii]|nr:hypothetical protein FR838_20335 [Acinetobacter pittii]
MFLKNKEGIENKFWRAVCILTILVIVISAVSLPFIDDILSFIKDISGTAATILIYAELSGDFPLGDSRQPTYKSLRPFDLVS